MGSATVDAQAHRDDALGGDTDMHVGRLAGDREVADEALGDEQLAAALDLLLGFLVGDDPEPHPDAVLLAQVGDREQQAREGALHVVGAPAEQPVPVEPRLELLGAPGDDVDVAVQKHRRRRRLGADLGQRHRQVAAGDLAGLDVAGVEPALDEPGAELDPLRGRGVVADQLLGQQSLVHG